MKGKGTPLKLQKEVKPFGDAAHVLVPKSWIGWQVQVKVIRPKGREGKKSSRFENYKDLEKVENYNSNIQRPS